MSAKHARYIAPMEPLATGIDSQVVEGGDASTRDPARTAIRVRRSKDARDIAVRVASARPLHSHGQV